jgi:hypothetical protein
MTIHHSKSVKQHIQIAVLGLIEGHGTAVLVDNLQRVWLYIQPSICG